ncbi:dual specificity protein phosphatase family protein [Candidatus Woesebacteria bacterium]|nr:dual specificity protein phosphatase family protein [Candidatus Woesebacteria bacterium]
MQPQQPNGRNDHHTFDFSEIIDGLYIGSDFCEGGICYIHGEEFKALNISIEINLSQEENELPPKNIPSYLWLPVVDGYAPEYWKLMLGSSAINDGLLNGKKVYVHCKNGHGRSPTLVAAYLIRFKNYKMEDALKLIKEKRPEVHIEDSQIKVLNEFAQKWSK